MSRGRLQSQSWPVGMAFVKSLGPGWREFGFRTPNTFLNVFDATVARALSWSFLIMRQISSCGFF